MDCIFCKIIAGEIPSEKLYEDDEMVIIKDINPVAKYHYLAIPKKHIPSMNEAGDDDSALIGRLVLRARDAAKKLGVEESGYRILINTNKDAGMIVYHIHFHILGGEKLKAI